MKSTSESSVEKAQKILREMISENCDENFDEKSGNAKRKVIRKRDVKFTVYFSDEEYAHLRELQEALQEA